MAVNEHEYVCSGTYSRDAALFYLHSDKHAWARVTHYSGHPPICVPPKIQTEDKQWVSMGTGRKLCNWGDGHIFVQTVILCDPESVHIHDYACTQKKKRDISYQHRFICWAFSSSLCACVCVLRHHQRSLLSVIWYQRFNGNSLGSVRHDQFLLDTCHQYAGDWTPTGQDPRYGCTQDSTRCEQKPQRKWLWSGSDRRIDLWGEGGDHLNNLGHRSDRIYFSSLFFCTCTCYSIVEL